MVRYFFWLLLLHLATAHRQYPHQFLVGLLMLPFYFVTALSTPKEERQLRVNNGVDSLHHAWSQGIIPAPPKLLKRKLLELKN